MLAAFISASLNAADFVFIVSSSIERYFELLHLCFTVLCCFAFFKGPPFIFYDPAKRNLGNEAFQGFCKDIIEKLAKDLNFTYDMYIVTPGSYSDKMSNGTSNGMIRDLIRKVKYRDKH